MEIVSWNHHWQNLPEQLSGCYKMKHQCGPKSNKKGHCPSQHRHTTAISYNWEAVGSPMDQMINALTIEWNGTQQSLTNQHLQQQSTTSIQSINMSIILLATVLFTQRSTDVLIDLFSMVLFTTINWCIDCLACNSSIHSTINWCINWLVLDGSIHSTINWCIDQLVLDNALQTIINWCIDRLVLNDALQRTNQLMHWWTTSQWCSSNNNQLMHWLTCSQLSSSLHNQQVCQLTGTQHALH